MKLVRSFEGLTTFMTAFGRYCIACLSFGIMSASEHFKKRMPDIFSSLLGVLKPIDDFLVSGSNEAQYYEHLKKTLDSLAESNMAKCVFGAFGIRLDHPGIIAVKSLKTPTNMFDV